MLGDLNYALIHTCVGKTDFTSIRVGHVIADLPNDETYIIHCSFPHLDRQTFQKVELYLARTRKNYEIFLLTPPTEQVQYASCDSQSTDPTDPQPATLATF